MSASGPRSRGARVHPRSCQGCQPWPRASAASGLVLATQKLDGITGRRTDAPSSNTCRLLARDHAAPESTLALAKAASLGRERVRPLAWCSRPRNSAALLEGALALRRRVLGRALRRDRRRGDAAAVVTADDIDVTPCAEEIRLGAVEDDRHPDVLVRP